jgi:aminopeptidase N
MHGYSAPVILHYDYTQEELACLMNHAKDPFSQWEAGQNYSLLAIQAIDRRGLLAAYTAALQSQQLSPLAKAQLLKIPSLRAISQKFHNYDFSQLQAMKASFTQQLATACKPYLEELLVQFPEPSVYAPTSEQMQIRELRHACLNLLAQIDPNYAQKLYQQIHSADNFDTAFAAFNILAKLQSPETAQVIAEFYEQWQADKILFNHWLQAQASSPSCTVADLKKLMVVKGYDAENPNHIRSVLCSFCDNLSQYHDSKGEGYAFIVDQILTIAPANPILASSYIASLAFLDFEMLPKAQQALLIREMKRLQSPAVLPEIRDLVQKLLEKS